MGSAGLLMEHLIHTQMIKTGIPNEKIEWRCIDIQYDKDAHLPVPDGLSPLCDHARINATMEQFKEDKNVRYFTTATTYLGKMVDDRKLSTTDKEKGAVIVLALNPPSIKSSSSSIFDPTDQNQTFGSPCKIEKANSCLMLFSAETQKEQLEAFVDKIDSSSMLQAALDLIKCSINSSGEPQLWISEELKKNIAENLSLTALQNNFSHYFKETDKNESTIIRVEKALNKLKEFFSKTNGHMIVFPYSDYRIRIDQLTHHFYTRKEDDIKTLPGALFELRKRQITITDRADFVNEPAGSHQS